MDDFSSLPSALWFANNSGAVLANNLDSHFTSIETDSRNVKKSSMFIAIKGERVDGHDFAYNAYKNGASSILVSEDYWNAKGKSLFADASCSLLVAKNPVLAMQTAAKAWCSKFNNLYKFGVTGSAGKTTTKEILSAILEQSHNVVKNPGNLNSDIGLAASVFLIRDSNDVAVFEMGINYPGEMDILTNIYKPNCAIITNIGSAHIGVLGGARSDIALEKKKIVQYFTGNETLVVREDDDFANFLVNGINGKYSFYGSRSTLNFNGARDLGLNGWEISWDDVNIHLALPGAHNLKNALAAMHTAALFGVSKEDIAKGVESIKALSGRTNIFDGKYTVIDDCYNANAESVESAIDFCSSLQSKNRKIFVLGSMKELGNETRSAHEKIGILAANSSADFIFFFGDETIDSYNSALFAKGEQNISVNKNYIKQYNDYEKLEKDVLATIKTGDLILVKGSRSMEMERLTNKLLL